MLYMVITYVVPVHNMNHKKRSFYAAQYLSVVFPSRKGLEFRVACLSLMFFTVKS